MSSLQSDPLLQVETTCGTLLYELQIIWDEVGESDTERDKMLLELERECLEVYRRKVDQANRSRAQLRQAIADSEAELVAMCSSMGERPVHIRQPDQSAVSLKEELKKILPQVEEMRQRKSNRKNQFLEVLGQIQSISSEIYTHEEYIPTIPVVDETDLSLRKLEDLHRQLHILQKEKSDRLKQVQDHLINLNLLCSVLGMDFMHTVSEIHPTIGDGEGPKNISNDTIEKLAAATRKLREVKLQRMQRLQDLATTMLELWNLMDTPIEEQQMFQNVTRNVAASEDEITEPNALSVDYINHVAAEVARLEEFKSSKMKELVMRKRSELEEICRKTHMVPESDHAIEYVIDAIESGAVDPSSVLEKIELQIAQVKEEAFSRKELLEKVEKWLGACDEECWLEEYNRDDNRYSAGRGAHLTLKRAEKARALVNKLPAMVDALASKTLAWENERGTEFTYDGIRLLSMLEEYTLLRQEKEQERRRLRDQKKLQGQLIAEQEALYGSKPSPSKPQSTKKAPRVSTGGMSGRRLSLGGTMHQTPKPDLQHSMKSTPYSRTRKSDRVHQNDQLINQYQDDSFAAVSAGGAGLDVTSHLLKKQSFGARESDLMRRPFSPISPVPSKASTTNFSDDPNIKQHETMQKTVVDITNTTPFTTPLKTTSIANEENRTPKAPISVPMTPSTVSVPMQTAITPAPPPVPFGGNAVEDTPQEIEYSFEERRAGFVLPNTHIKSMIQV